MESPEKKEPSPDITLGMLIGPNMFIRIQLCPSEFKPYFLDRMLDSGCQVNLAKGLALPLLYWENTTDRGTTIEGTQVPLVAKVEKFPMKFNETTDAVTWYKLDNIKEDCILGSEFLDRVSPFSFDKKKMLFSCVISNCTSSFLSPLVFCPQYQSFVQKSV